MNKLPKREQLAIELCDDLLKKFAQLEKMSEEKVKNTLEGVIDGLTDNTIEHPYPEIPNVRRSMNPHYCGGFEVGETWRKIAGVWDELD